MNAEALYNGLTTYEIRHEHSFVNHYDRAIVIAVLDNMLTITAENAALKAQLAAAEPVGYVASFECNEFGFVDMKAFREGEFTTPVYKTAPPQHAARVPDQSVGLALNWMGEKTNLELAYDYGDDYRESAWVVWQVNGGRNDREWTEVARHKNIREVLLLAAPTPPAQEGE